MSAKTQFWLGSLMLAAAVGILVGGLLYPRPSYSQDNGEGRAGNFAIVASNITGTKPKSQIVYLLDDRNEVLYVLETTGLKGSQTELRDFVDLREFSTGVQKKRADRDKRMK